jgi:hypothetical protein
MFSKGGRAGVIWPCVPAAALAPQAIPARWRAVVPDGSLPRNDDDYTSASIMRVVERASSR